MSSKQLYINQFKTCLNDQTPILIRPLNKDDWQRIQSGYILLSENSRFSRFFDNLKSLDDQFAHYLSDVDQLNHIAWGAADLSHPEIPGIGIGRYICLKNDPTMAEIAITVVDSYQRRGLGSILFGILYLMARSHGVTTFLCYVHPVNRFLCAFLNELGAKVSYKNGINYVELPIIDPNNKKGLSGSQLKFQQILYNLNQKLQK